MDSQSLSKHIEAIHSKITELYGLNNSLTEACLILENRTIGEGKEEVCPSPKTMEMPKVSIMENIENVSKRLTILIERLQVNNTNLRTLL